MFGFRSTYSVISLAVLSIEPRVLIPMRNWMALIPTMVTAVLVAMVTFSSPLSAQMFYPCPGAVMCTGGYGMGTTCSVSWPAGGNFCPNMTTQIQGMSAMCLVDTPMTSTKRGVALNSSASGNSGVYCTWRVQTAVTTTMSMFSFCQPQPAFECGIDKSDGLPVELMEFSIEPAPDVD